MPRSLEDIRKALGGHGQDYLEGLDAIIAAEGEKFAEELSKKNREGASLRTRLKDAEGARDGAKKQIATLLKHLGIDDDVEDLEEALAELKNKPDKGGKNSDSEMARRVAKLEKLLEKEKADRETLVGAERTKRHELLAKNAIMAALVTGKAAKPEVLSGAIRGNVKVLDDESIVYEGADGKQVPVNEGIAAWLKANPEFVVSGQTGGSGSSGGTGGGAGGGAKTEIDAAREAAEARNKGTATAGGVVEAPLNPWK